MNGNMMLQAIFLFILVIKNYNFFFVFYHEPHEQGANLESKEIYYKYASSREV